MRTRQLITVLALLVAAGCARPATPPLARTVAIGPSATVTRAVAAATLPELGRLKAGTTYKPTIEYKVALAIAAPFTLEGVPPYLRITSVVGNVVTATIPDAAQIPGEHTAPIWVRKNGAVVGIVAAQFNCGSSSGCGKGPYTAPTPPPSVPPSPARSVVPTSGGPTAQPTALPTTVPSAGASAPPPQPTSAPPPPGGGACLTGDAAEPPHRYTPREVSLRLEVEYDQSNPFKWDARNGCTATQYIRRNMDAQRLVYLRQVQTYLDGLGPSGAYVADKIDGIFYDLKSELAPYVFGLSLKYGTRGGSWQIDSNGFYGKTGAGLERAQQYLTSSLATSQRCASTLAPPLRQLLDLVVVHGRCVKDSAAARHLPVKQEYVPYRAALGTIQTHTPRPRPSDACLAAIGASHACHRATALANCGLGARPACSTSRRSGSAESRNPGMDAVAAMNAAMMRRFYAEPDYDNPATAAKDGWTPAEICDWFLIADEFHGRWHQHFVDTANPFSWAPLEIEDENHARAHDILTRYSATTKWTFWDAGGRRFLPAMTAPQFLTWWRTARPDAARHGGARRRERWIMTNHSVTLRKQVLIKDVDVSLEVTMSLSLDGGDASSGAARGELTDAALAALEELESRLGAIEGPFKV